MRQDRSPAHAIFRLLAAVPLVRLSEERLRIVQLPAALP
jgi:hypothetical protein